MKSRVYLGLGLLTLLIVAVFSVTDRVGAHTRITTDVTWSENIREIFIEKCMTCHHPGGISPDYVNFTVYGTDTEPGARAWAVAIEEEIMTGRMPPWKPDSRFGRFANVKELTDLEIDLITAWIGGGAPQGPYRNLPVPEQFLRPDWAFGRPDLVFSFPRGHVVPADQILDEAVIVLPVEIEEDTYITGYEFLVENPKNIFRMTAYIHDPKGVEFPPLELEVQTEYDPLADEDAAEVVRLREMPKGPHFIGQWVRGDGPLLFPDAAGRLLRKGSTVEFRIEYRRPEFADWSQEIRDNSKLGLFVAQQDEEIDLLVESMVIENPDFVIKAQAASQEVRAQLTMDESVHLIGINPYMGPLATSLEVKATYADGLEQTLIWIPDYQKRWTASYEFERPVAAPAGTVIELIARYNNTEDNWDNPNSPPIDVSSGLKPDQERLTAILNYMLDDHLNIQEEFVPPERTEAQSGGGMILVGGPDGGLLGLGDPGPPSTDASEEPLQRKDGEPSVEEEQSPIRMAANGFHQVEAVMEKPGEVQIFIYDADLLPLNPHNFSGEIELEDGESLALSIHHLGDDYLSAWVSPSFPVSFEAKLALAGKEERFSFSFDGLSVKAEEMDTSGRKFKPAPHGGWIYMVDDGRHRIEATLERHGDLRLYFYDDDLNPIDARNFLNSSVVQVDTDTGSTLSKPMPMTYARRGDEYLSVDIPKGLPISVDAYAWFGADKKKFRFDFDELTEEPWGDWGEEPAREVPLIAGPHGSPEIFASSNGFHYVEGAMPRPGEFRLYFYDEWKTSVDPQTFSGTLHSGGREIPLEHYAVEDDYLTAFVEPVFPVQFSSKVWITGQEESFRFSFEGVTIDPAYLEVPSAHMDHEPLHGGQFFMADNMFHHVEGALPRPGEFRAYFYDNFKQPIDPRSFSGTVYVETIQEDTGQVTEDAYELFYAKPGDEHLTAVVPATLPLNLYSMISLGGEDKRFDFPFEVLTVEPARRAVASAPGGTRDGTHDHYRPPVRIPDTIEGIVDEILNRDGDLVARIKSRDWGTLFIPAFDARDLLAALPAKDAGFSARQQGRLKMVISAVNRSVGKIERTAHSNDPPRVEAAYDDFADGIADLLDLYSAFLQ